MCTVTLIARRHGYLLGMNRDEKLTRVPGLPPAVHDLAGRRALFPSEPAGGTWVGVNDAHVTYALINWYSVPRRVTDNAASRGNVVRAALALDTAAAVENALAAFPLTRTNPFRLVGIFPGQAAVIEWRWDLLHLQRLTHPWAANIWISSGFDEPGAQRTRRAAFDLAPSAGEHDRHWLRSLHTSHGPAAGPYSICMHRADAATVSYTEIEVTGSIARVGYAAGTPCARAGHGVTASAGFAMAYPRLQNSDPDLRFSIFDIYDPARS